MDAKKLVRLSNTIGLVSIVLLVYWVFTFISIEVFGLKIFKENMTETFFMSIFAILALMFGALMINIMFNLTRIAEKHNQDADAVKVKNKKVGWLIALSFPVILVVLFGGDLLTSKRKERLLVQAAASIIAENKEQAAKLANYKFENKWIKEAGDILTHFTNMDNNFPNISVIVSDSMDKSRVFLSYSQYVGYLIDTVEPDRNRYILKTKKPERDYFQGIFDRNGTDYRFSAHDGTYELYYPYTHNGKTIILYFSDYQRYGKIGS